MPGYATARPDGRSSRALWMPVQREQPSGCQSSESTCFRARDAARGITYFPHHYSSMQSRTKLLVGIATVTTVAFAFARRRSTSSDAEAEANEPAVAEEELESARQ